MGKKSIAKRRASKKPIMPDEPAAAPAIPDGAILDFISQKPLKDTAKEAVRQEVARALTYEYQIAPEDMALDFPVKAEGRRKKVDLAVFAPGTEHRGENLRRAVVCRPQPNVGKRGVVRIRDHEQAKKDLEEVQSILNGVDGCEWGLWTNGIERFFLKKEKRRFMTEFEPKGDWPMADGTMATPDVHSEAYLRKGDETALRRAFQRCHNFIHGNEGMPKDAAFWQFLYLIFAKMYDERVNRNGERLFWAGAAEPFTEEGRMKIRSRIDKLFATLKKSDLYGRLFKERDEITLSSRALAYMVAELARYDFTRSDVEAKGVAYQEIVGTNLRGDRGQYFTPRRVVNLAVRMLDPKLDERLLDPACGTGGFLVATIAHQLRRLKAEQKAAPGERTSEAVLDRLRDYARKQVFGADFDPFLVRASTMNLVMAAGAEGRVFHVDSLAFPNSHLEDNAKARTQVPLGSVDVLMTNPPFGSEIPITEPAILESNPLARRWERGDDGWVETSSLHRAVAPEILFIAQAWKWLRPGGRMAIVLPNGILGNPGDEPVRRWILRHFWVLGCVEIPVETFIVEADVGILTSLLLLKKKTEDEEDGEARGHVADYPIFMAVAERAGVDRRGNPLYKRNPDGTEKLVELTQRERVVLNGKPVERTRKVVAPELDDDFPAIGAAYEEFRRKNREPGKP